MNRIINIKHFAPKHSHSPQRFQTKLLLSIFRIATPVIGIVCGISLLMLSQNYRQTVINSQAAATEKSEVILPTCWKILRPYLRI